MSGTRIARTAGPPVPAGPRPSPARLPPLGSAGRVEGRTGGRPHGPVRDVCYPGASGITLTWAKRRLRVRDTFPFECLPHEGYGRRGAPGSRAAASGPGPHHGPRSAGRAGAGDTGDRPAGWCWWPATASSSGLPLSVCGGAAAPLPPGSTSWQRRRRNSYRCSRTPARRMRHSSTGSGRTRWSLRRGLSCTPSDARTPGRRGADRSGTHPPPRALPAPPGPPGIRRRCDAAPLTRRPAYGDAAAGHRICRRPGIAPRLGPGRSATPAEEHRGRVRGRRTGAGGVPGRQVLAEQVGDETAHLLGSLRRQDEALMRDLGGPAHRTRPYGGAERRRARHPASPRHGRENPAREARARPHGRGGPRSGQTGGRPAGSPGSAASAPNRSRVSCPP